MKLLLAGLLCLISAIAAAEVLLVDVNNKPIGYFLDRRSADEIVALRYGARVIRVTVRRSGFVPEGGIAFTEPSCAGTPYLIARGRPDLFQDGLRAVVSARRTLYLRVPGSTLATRTFVSGRGALGCINSQPESAPSFEARAIVNLREIFEPPFRFLPPDNVTDISLQ